MYERFQGLPGLMHFPFGKSRRAKSKLAGCTQGDKREEGKEGEEEDSGLVRRNANLDNEGAVGGG